MYLLDRNTERELQYIDVLVISIGTNIFFFLSRSREIAIWLHQYITYT